jgi:hypothetical protein
VGPNNQLVCYEILVVSCKYSNKPSDSEDAKFMDNLSTAELFKKDAVPAISCISVK